MCYAWNITQSVALGVLGGALGGGIGMIWGAGMGILYGIQSSRGAC